MYMLKKIIYFCYLIIFCNVSHAADNKTYLMLKKDKVYVRYGPSFDYPIKYIYKKINLPLKVIDKKENFRKIIDYKKNSGWIHISLLRKSKSLITTSNKILFKRPTKFSKPIAKLDEGRLLLIKKCEEDWCNVKTGKFSGWIKKNNVWGI